jgi:hypothetical protein
VKIQDLFENRVTEGDVDDALHEIEPQLPYEARFKRIDVDMDDRIVYWVTQEMEDEAQLRRTARIIAKLLLKKKLGVWSVYMCLRDNFVGFDDGTDWVKFESI